MNKISERQEEHLNYPEQLDENSLVFSVIEEQEHIKTVYPVQEYTKGFVGEFLNSLNNVISGIF